MNNGERNKKQANNVSLSARSFHIMNPKSDPSQNGSPIPFQKGDFTSAEMDKGLDTFKTPLEVFVFYFLGITLSISGFYVLVTWDVFSTVIDNTILSFGILLAIIIISFMISRILSVLISKILK